jgi:tetrahydromethanopterin S-methyltransferase subunit G
MVLQGDPTTCGWIRSEEQYEAWFRKQAKEKQMLVQSPLDSDGGDVIGDLKQQLADVKHTLDSVVSELLRLKLQIGNRPTIDRSPVSDPSRISNATEELGNRKMQIVMDVSVVVGVLVGLLVCAVVAQMMK